MLSKVDHTCTEHHIAEPGVIHCLAMAPCRRPIFMLVVFTYVNIAQAWPTVDIQGCCSAQEHLIVVRVTYLVIPRCN